MSDGEWEARQDGSGNTYYYCAEKEESVWVLPPGARLRGAPPPPPPPPGPPGGGAAARVSLAPAAALQAAGAAHLADGGGDSGAEESEEESEEEGEEEAVEVEAKAMNGRAAGSRGRGGGRGRGRGGRGGSARRFSSAVARPVTSPGAKFRAAAAAAVITGSLAKRREAAEKCNQWVKREREDGRVYFTNLLNQRTVNRLPPGGVLANEEDIDLALQNEAIELDIGTKTYKHLSSVKLQQYVNENHPRQHVKNDDGTTEAKPFSWCGSDAGWHWVGRYSKSDFIVFGVGISLYFKFLKFMAVLFLQMTFLALPAMLFYYQSDTSETVNAIEMLGKFTLGNIGEGKSVCSTAMEHSDLFLGCPEGQTIGKVDVFYGDPSGSCECPAEQAPDPECPDEVAGSVCADGGYCFLVDQRQVRVQGASGFTAGPCCASYRTDFIPDFSDLDFSIPSGCSSDSAQRIVEGRCLGRSGCTIPVEGDLNITWIPDVEHSTYCAGRSTVPTLTQEEAAAALLEERRQAERERAEQLGGSDPGGPDTDGEVAPLTDEELTQMDVDRGALCSESFTSAGDFSTCATDRPRRMAAIARCFSTTVTFRDWEFRKTDLAILVGLLDFFSTVLFISSIVWLGKKEHTEVDKFDEKNITAGDYTVYLKHVPPHDSVGQLKSMLKQHFEEVLNAEDPTWEGMEEEEIRIRGVRRVEVADINFGLNIGALLRLLKQRGSLLSRFELLQKRALFHDVRRIRKEAYKKSGKREDQDEAVRLSGITAATAKGPPKVQQRIAKVLAKLKEVDEKLDALEALQGDVDEIMESAETPGASAAAMTPEQLLAIAKARRKNRPTRAVCAYVTFEEEEGYVRCIEAFPNHWILYCLQARHKRLNGHRLHVEPAPEPSDILWENLEISACASATRGVVTGLVSVLVVLISAALAVWGEESKRAALRQFPPADCATLQDPYNASLVVPDEFPEFYNLTEGKTGRLECFCKNMLFTQGPQVLLEYQFGVPQRLEVAGVDLTGATGRVEYVEEPLCSAWFDSFTQISALTYGGSVAVIVINSMLKLLLKAMVKWERHSSITKELTSRFVKLFLVQLLNTAFIVLLVNASFNFNSASLLPGADFIGKGKYEDFSAGWYATVGGSITLTMLINLFVPHAWPVVEAFLHCFKRCKDRGWSMDRTLTKKATQRTLNEQYLGPNLLIAERYAQAMVVIFVTMTYSTGLPLLYGVALINFVLVFWMDKLLFTHFYRTPPSYTDAFAKATIALLPYGALLHLGFGMWMLGNSNVFQKASASLSAAAGAAGDIGDVTDQTAALTGGGVAALDGSGAGGLNISSRVSAGHVIPLFLLTLVVIVLLVWRKLLYPVLKGVLRTLCGCCCSTRPEYEGLPNYYDALPLATLVTAERERRGGHSILSEEQMRRYQDRLAAEADFMNIGVDELVEGTYVEQGRRRSVQTPLGPDDAGHKHYDPSARVQEMVGIVSYDLNANANYIRAFGLSAEVPLTMKRSLKIGAH